MNKLILAFALLLAAGAPPARAVLTETVSETVQQTIPDDGGSGLGRTITYTSGVHGVVPGAVWTGVRVRLQTAGGYNGDLWVLLERGTNAAVLLNRPGRTATRDAGYGDAGLDVVFDDAAVTGDVHLYRTRQDPAGGILTGTWQPDGRDVDPDLCLDTDPRTALLSGLVDGDPNGEWSLAVLDNVAGDQATWVAWEIEFLYTTPPEIAVHSGPGGTAAAALTSGQVAAVSLGTTAQGVPVSREFTVANSGHQDLSVSAVTVPPGFLAVDLPALPFSLGAGESRTFSIVLTAAAGGTQSGQVVVASDDADEATFSFPVTGIVDGNAPSIVTCAGARTLTMTGPTGPALPDLRGEVVASDIEPGTLTVTQSPAGGTVLSPGATLVVLTVRDQAGNTATCEALVTVVRPPVAGADFSDTLRDIPVALRADKLLANDSDPDGASLSLVAVDATSAGGGTVGLAGGVITYTPAAGFTGSDTFGYTLRAGGRESIGRVTVRVRSTDLIPLNAVYLRPAASPGTGMDLRFSGLAGKLYSVQFAAVLGDPWVELARVTAQGATGFVDHRHSGAPPTLGFYRCVPAQ